MARIEPERCSERCPCRGHELQNEVKKLTHSKHGNKKQSHPPPNQSLASETLYVRHLKVHRMSSDVFNVSFSQINSYCLISPAPALSLISQD